MLDYLHGSDENLRKGAKKTYANLRGNYTRYGVPDPQTDLKKPIDDFDVALDAAQDTNTGEEATAYKNRMRTIVIDALRSYVNRYLVGNPNVTEEDMIALGMHRNKPRTPIVPPNLIPIVVVILALLRQVTFKYYAQPGPKQRMGKPQGVAKFVVYYLISDTPPKNFSELVHKAEVSSGPLVLNFRDEDRGKKLYYVVCWAIEHDGLEGPKSQIEFVIIP